MAVKTKRLLATALSAAVVVGLGIWLWWSALGDSLEGVSYDYLFRLGARSVTNQVTLILMDNGAFSEFHQTRGEPWDRALHAQLLNRLADDGAALVVLDAFFGREREPVADAALTAAIARQKRMVLMGSQTRLELPGVEGMRPVLPLDGMLAAARTNWGVAWLNPDNAGFVREHWPFPSPGAYPSLPWAAAQVMGANLSPTPQPRWLRYYDTSRSWTRLSYQYALSQPPGYYKDRIVFVGLWPSTPMPNGEDDEFCTPFTRWTKESSGGVEILLTEFFNLWRGESLERPGAPVEAGVLILAGLVLGTGFCRLRGPWSLVTGAGIFLGLFLAAVLLTTYTNYWFPWLLIAGAQLPAAMAGGWAVQRWLVPAPAAAPVKGAVPVKTAVLEPVLTVPGLTLIHPPFGQGAYGKVWLGRTPAGEWRAVKAVYRARFGEAAEPYDREYSGVKKFQPLSGKHPGFLRVEQVSEKRADYFYYVMELGDALDPGWEAQPTAYKPQDLTSVCARQPNGRLPLATVREMGIALCEALAFLHDAGMTHRDIKPSNIILAGGRPKLADVGLLTDLREETQERSIVGTPGFMPPEQPGTVRADLYALGMVLYVIATGQSPMKFPDLPTLLMEGEDTGDQLQLNQIVLKACQPNPLHRYADMRELAEELKRL